MNTIKLAKSEEKFWVKVAFNSFLPRLWKLVESKLVTFNFTKKKFGVYFLSLLFQANRRCRCHQEHQCQGHLRYYHQGRTKGSKEEITRCTKGKWATCSRRSYFSPQQQFCGGRNFFCTTHYYDEVT